MKLSAAFSLLVLVPCLGAAERTASSTRPNILYLLADDLGYGDVQCLNPQRAKIVTPQIDRFARQGMTFTDAHGGSSVCTPTRYGLLTGRYAWRTRLQQGVLDGGNDEPLISADRLTLPGFLRQQGYATACIGKWHLGYVADAKLGNPKEKGRVGGGGPPVGARIIGGPTARGFDYFWGCSNARTMASLVENDRVVEILPPIEMLPRLIARAQDYVAEKAATAKSGHPFFLYVALTAPHLPLVPSPEWQGKSPLGPYGDFVMQTDDAVGRILAALDREGLAQNTLVVVASDNGCAVQVHVDRLESRGHFASAQYRGYKADIWEGGHRVPFFVRWPQVVKSASESAATIGLGDFMSTMAEVLGVRLPEAASPDGVSFLPALQGKPMMSPRQAIVLHSAKGEFAIREGKWKLALGGGSGGYGQPGNDEAVRQGLPDAQLYDLETDPAETTNHVTTHQEQAARLLQLLQSYVKRGRSTPGAALANDVPVNLPEPKSIRAPGAP